jgi:hypothetical protein
MDILRCLIMIQTASYVRLRGSLLWSEKWIENDKEDVHLAFYFWDEKVSSLGTPRDFEEFIKLEDAPLATKITLLWGMMFPSDM